MRCDENRRHRAGHGLDEISQRFNSSGLALAMSIAALADNGHGLGRGEGGGVAIEPVNDRRSNRLIPGPESALRNEPINDLDHRSLEGD